MQWVDVRVGNTLDLMLLAFTFIGFYSFMQKWHFSGVFKRMTDFWWTVWVGVWARNDKTTEVWRCRWRWWLGFHPFEPIDGSLPHYPPPPCVAVEKSTSLPFAKSHFMRQWRIKGKIWELTMHIGRHGNDCWGALPSAELQNSPKPSWDSELPFWAHRTTSAFNMKTILN